MCIRSGIKNGIVSAILYKGKAIDTVFESKFKTVFKRKDLQMLGINANYNIINCPPLEVVCRAG